MGAFHGGHLRAVRRRPRRMRHRRRQPLRQPGAVRRRRGSRGVSARRGARPRGGGGAGVDFVFARRSRRCTRRLPDLGRRDGARRDPRGRAPARPLPRRGDCLPQALHDRPAGRRVLRPEGRAAGGGDPPPDPRPRAPDRAPRRRHRARRRRPRALVAQRRAVAGRAPRCARAAAGARDEGRRRGARAPERPRRRLRRDRSFRSTRARRRHPRRREPVSSTTSPSTRRCLHEHATPQARPGHARARQAAADGARRDEAARPEDRHGHRLRRSRRSHRGRGRRRHRARRRLGGDDRARPLVDRPGDDGRDDRAHARRHAGRAAAARRRRHAVRVLPGLGRVGGRERGSLRQGSRRRRGQDRGRRPDALPRAGARRRRASP